MPLSWYWAVAHALVTALITLLLLTQWRRWLRLDLPEGRRSHTIATPRGGGLAILVAMVCGDGVAMLLWPSAAKFIGISGVGLVMVGWVGWKDDRHPLPIVDRLLVHAMASALLAGLIFQASHSWLLACAIFFSGLVLINVWNFMDGINGLAVSQTALIAFVYALTLPSPISIIPLAIMFSCLAFLPFNFPQARIFLGDCGSYALGYAIAICLGLIVLQDVSRWFISWLPLTVFLVDAGYTLVRRFVLRQRWWEPHAQHVYQRAARHFSRHTPVTLIYLGLSSLAGLLFTLLLHLSIVVAVVGLFGWLFCLTIAWYLSCKGLKED